MYISFNIKNCTLEKKKKKKISMGAELHYIRKLIMQSLQEQQNKFICIS